MYCTLDLFSVIHLRLTLEYQMFLVWISWRLNLRFSCVWVRALPWRTMETERDRLVQKSAVMRGRWKGNRCVTRRTGTESAEGRNEEVKERELYPPPLLLVQTERWERGERQRDKGRRKKQNGTRRKEGFRGKTFIWETEREKKRTQGLLFVRSTLPPIDYWYLIKHTHANKQIHSQFGQKVWLEHSTKPLPSSLTFN